MKMRVLLVISILCMGLGGNAGAAMYDLTPAIAISAPTVFSNNGVGGGIGYAFIPDSDIVATELGLFDGEGDGFFTQQGAATAHFVGVYGADGSYIASATVSIDNGTYADSFRYAPITEGAVNFLAGVTYYIFSEAGYEDYAVDGFLVSRNDMTLAGFDFYIDTPSTDALIMGSIAPLESMLIGPNFRYTPVPIPGGLWLLGSGLVFLIARKQRSFSSR